MACCSEYRQAEGTLVSNVALRLLTTDAPTETKQDLAASAQLVSSTGTATTQPAHLHHPTCWLQTLMPYSSYLHLEWGIRLSVRLKSNGCFLNSPSG